MTEISDRIFDVVAKLKVSKCNCGCNIDNPRTFDHQEMCSTRLASELESLISINSAQYVSLHIAHMKLLGVSVCN